MLIIFTLQRQRGIRCSIEYGRGLHVFTPHTSTSRGQPGINIISSLTCILKFFKNTQTYRNIHPKLPVYTCASYLDTRGAHNCYRNNLTTVCCNSCEERRNALSDSKLCTIYNPQREIPLKSHIVFVTDHIGQGALTLTDFCKVDTVLTISPQSM